MSRTRTRGTSAPSLRIWHDTVMLRVLTSLLLCPALAQPAMAQQPSGDLAKRLLPATDIEGNPALLVAVVKGGKTLAALSKGTADIKKKTPAAAKTLFPLGGMTRLVSNLVIADLAAGKRLSPAKPVNRHLGKRPIRDLKGKAVDTTLLEVIRGSSRLPEHRHFMVRKDLHQWPLDRALREHAFQMPEPTRGSDLDYGVVQRVVESVTSQPWDKVVEETVFAAAGIKDSVADARIRLPEPHTRLYRLGFFRKPIRETRVHSNFVAANGAWFHAADMAKLLLHLTRKKHSMAAARQLIEFAGFRVRKSVAYPYRVLVLDLGMPGMRGAIHVYPQHRIAWALLSNINLKAGSKSLLPVHSAIEAAVLPPSKEQYHPKAKEELFGGRFVRPVSGEYHGTWSTEIPLNGRPHPLRLAVNSRGFQTVSVPSGKRAVVKGRGRDWMVNPIFNFNNVLPVRPDLRLQARMNLKPCEDPKTIAFEGHLILDHPCCHMEWWIKVRKD